MDRRQFLQRAGLTALAVSVRLAPASSAEEPMPRELGDLLEDIRSEHQLPGIAAAVVEGDAVTAHGVAGVGSSAAMSGSRSTTAS